MKKLSVDEAYKHWQRAGSQLTQAVHRAFPVGSTIEVTIGHARIRARVNAIGGHSCAEVYCTNLVTGKPRHFWAASDYHNPVLISK